jgi:hypothetical protein
VFLNLFCYAEPFEQTKYLAEPLTKKILLKANFYLNVFRE